MTEELLETYQSYVSTTSLLESQLKPAACVSPERLSDLQAEMSRLEGLKKKIDSADVSIKELGSSLSSGVEANSGSTGLEERKSKN